MTTDQTNREATVQRWWRNLWVKTIAIVIVAISTGWLYGYMRAVLPFAGDYLRDPDFTFLTFPNVKFYRIADSQSGSLSQLQVDLFSVSDGPTGVEYNELYIPCWAISLGALAGISAGAYAFFNYPNRLRTI